MSSPKHIQLGLCCLNLTLREQKPPIYCSRRMIIRTIEEKGIDVLKEKILDNLADVIKLIEWNEKNGIRVLRLSSELFPHKSNSKVENYDFDFAIDSMKKIGDKAREYGHRLTFHPGQYNVVGTPDIDKFNQTICDLKYQADVLDYMEMDQHSVMVVHGGGIYGDKEKTIDRWIKQFDNLPNNVKKRLVIENCEKCFSIKDCIIISQAVNIPIVFDTHHFDCYKILHPEEIFEEPSYYMPIILETWNKRDIKPKFHVSEQGSGKVGHHSDYIENIPDYLLEIPEKYNVPIDIMIEAKMKELAIFKLYSKYPMLNCKNLHETNMSPESPKLPESSTSHILVNNENLKKYLNECECCEDKPKKKKKRKKLVIVGL